MADILNKLNSANYITVKVTDDAITNGNNLLAAYALAKTKLPNGASLSSSNRLVILLPVAKYDLGTKSLTLDTQYIDIVGSTSDRSKHYITSNVGVISRGTVQQTANDVDLFNLTIENSNTTNTISTFSDTNPAAYFPNTNLNLTYIENVLFTSNSSSAWSMRIAIQYSGTFKDCTGGTSSFGSQTGTLSGTFINCTGGDYSFGGAGNFISGTLSGTFINCTGGNYSFGGGVIAGGTLTGIFTNCIGGNYAFASTQFGSGGSISGIFTNCTGGNFSFRANTTFHNGNFVNCKGGASSFFS